MSTKKPGLREMYDGRFGAIADSALLHLGSSKRLTLSTSITYAIE